MAIFTTDCSRRGNEPFGLAHRFAGRGLLRFGLCLGLIGAVGSISRADGPAADASEQSKAKARQQPLLTTEEWRRVDRAVERGLRFISKSQLDDGSFPTAANGQPGVTSLCVMALLARGHQPEKGPYGAQIARAIDYVLSIQDPEVGSIFPERFVNGRAPYSFSGNYNHGISALMLAEVYGMTNANRRERIRGVITKALKYTRAATATEAQSG